ncbi:MAG: acyl-CoA thioesterase [Betaproteobacteria bacterium]|jgi:acyl-CoA thioester hydrolase|nr:acyl-CoA thioesterase [Pseudomonadota bacterium]NBO02714.1 acyl-CoA thioesterase [Betaproteobacteria bacterium]NBO95135.1 acyl-CoA thioesterase [Betaproteobacteria bacterium]NBP36076.1 acyl-CoA thioesterase [Betaproteobacteria bacterium]NBP37582.1 acyl-CoA thioesterase [Betaproteobacteria bacterium]
MNIEDFRFLHPMRVRWAEADMQGVVFNANYLLFFDVASTEYYRQVSGGNRDLLKSVFDRLYVVKSTIEYLQPAHFDDELLVGVKTERIGRSSMTVNFGIFREGQHLIRGENVYVYAEDGRSMALPEDFKARIETMERASV